MMFVILLQTESLPRQANGRLERRQLQSFIFSYFNQSLSHQQITLERWKLGKVRGRGKKCGYFSPPASEK